MQCGPVESTIAGSLARQAIVGQTVTNLRNSRHGPLATIVDGSDAPVVEFAPPQCTIDTCGFRRLWWRVANHASMCVSAHYLRVVRLLRIVVQPGA
jgi:hypothetical protein